MGGAVVRALTARGELVRVLSRSASDHQFVDTRDVEIVMGDLRDPNSLKRAVRGCRKIYHVAAEYSLWSRDPTLLYASNVEGTKNLIRAASDGGVDRMVYTSTVGALGNPGDGTPGNERTPVVFSEMSGDYKKSKFLAEEEVIQAFEKDARYTNEFRPIASLILKIIQERKFPKRREAQFNFLADSLAGLGLISPRRSRDICERERNKKVNYIVRQDYYIECTCRYKGPALHGSCTKCGTDRLALPFPAGGQKPSYSLNRM